MAGGELPGRGSQDGGTNRKMPALGSLRVVVDAACCQGHNRCKAIAPTLFDLDEYGHARPAGDGLVPSELEAKARLAEANCPEFAIKLETLTTGEPR